jgi:hypothetical protein
MNRPYCKVPTRAASAGLSAAALRVLIYLCAYADDETGQCFPTKKTIARETGLHPRTVRGAVEELEAAELIQTEHRLDAAGDPTSNLYTVHLRPRVVALKPPPRGVHVMTVVAQTPPKQNHLTEPPNRRACPRAKERARPLQAETSPPSSASSRRELEDELRMKAYREHGIWLLSWGSRQGSRMNVGAAAD